MIRQFTILAIAGLCLAMSAVPRAAQAENFRVVDSDTRFVSLIEGRELRRLGIRLTVTPSGQIQGRAFGGPVTGQWRWENGYFCRDLFWNDTDLGYNCQLVQENGATLRFTSDQGAGMFADLTLE
ncbi:dihydrodipicolinate reductase [Roseicyclus sp.]|uniref:dihydrodipicolinate reductase n=1 Tax=Roseicyclus sp. TaxID=1914329 RepID=UPI003F6BBD80